MTDKLKKQIILNLPYLIFVYLFDKLCQGVRLAPGADASEKLLHIGQGFSAAFDSLAPSFHLVDLCVGAAGAVLIRLVVYSKGKNAKKYDNGSPVQRKSGDSDAALYFRYWQDSGATETFHSRLCCGTPSARFLPI